MAQRPAIVPERGQRAGASSDPRLDWWRDAKFGLFIHWGLYVIRWIERTGPARSGGGEAYEAGRFHHS
jgi:alpha-L-fucosidase